MADRLEPRSEHLKDLLLVQTRKLFSEAGQVAECMLIDKADKLLISHSQWLLKAEWEKVKFEARGPLYRWLHSSNQTALDRNC